MTTIRYKSEGHGSYLKVFEASNPRHCFSVFLTTDGWEVIDCQTLLVIEPSEKLRRAISRAFTKHNVTRAR